MATTIEERNGFEFKIKDGTNTSVTHGSREYQLDQTVTSSGYLYTKGLQGKIVKINFPFTDGRTTDIIAVDFGNGPQNCKFNDLQ